MSPVGAALSIGHRPYLTRDLLAHVAAKGALRYQEVDDKDQPLETVWEPPP